MAALAFDMVASRVHGLVKARDVRVVWVDGTLYVAKSPDDITTFQTDQPTKRGGAYQVVVGDDTIRMQPPSCGSCRRRVLSSPIGQMTVNQIVEAANSVGVD